MANRNPVTTKSHGDVQTQVYMPILYITYVWPNILPVRRVKKGVNFISFPLCSG